MRSRETQPSDLGIAEAAAWLARLQSGDRPPSVEAAFKDWVNDPDHAEAFARATDVWEVIPGAALLGRPRHRPSPPRAATPAMVTASAVAILIGITALVIAPTPSSPKLIYATAPGQEKDVALGDGTRITLNTNSKLIVEYFRNERRVSLPYGEAMFSVVKNQRRPFIVEGSYQLIRDIGTQFVVRNDKHDESVLLLEGTVEVSRKVDSKLKPVATLKPGERLTLAATGQATIDHPDLEAATAWRQGQIMFDDTSLEEAVEEMNRYGGSPIRLGGSNLAQLRVSGIFSTNASEQFARAVARLHHLRAITTTDGIVIGS